MLAKRLQQIEDRLYEKCVKTGRKREEITLIAVSKMQPVEVIEEAIAAGVTNLGENKAQELKEKAEQISKDVNWHFIGHLQTNKVKYVIKPAALIHSIDSIKLADEINKKALQISKKQNVLLEIKTSGETEKYGLEEEKEIMETAEFCEQSSNLNLIGLMTMAPFTENEVEIRKSFSKLFRLKEKMNSSGFSLFELSMGMTNDFEIAVEEGATMLRIGTAIFGLRNY